MPNSQVPKLIHCVATIGISGPTCTYYDLSSWYESNLSVAQIPGTPPVRCVAAKIQ